MQIANYSAQRTSWAPSDLPRDKVKRRYSPYPRILDDFSLRAYAHLTVFKCDYLRLSATRAALNAHQEQSSLSAYQPIPAPVRVLIIVTLARCDLPIKTAEPHLSGSAQKFRGRDSINGSRNNFDQQLEAISSDSWITEVKGRSANGIAQLTVSTGYANHRTRIKRNQVTYLRFSHDDHPRISAQPLVSLRHQSQNSPPATQ